MSLKIGLGGGRQDQSRLGMGLMILGLALYSASDAFIKHLIDVYPVHQTTFLRAFTRFIPLMIASFFMGGPKSILATQHPKNHLIRLIVNLAYTYAFMYSFSMESLTVVYTFSYTSPLFMIILGSFLLKEKISPYRWGAAGLGLLGVAIAMGFGFHMFEWAAIVVLFATFLGALNKILMRRLSVTEHTLSIAIYPNIGMILITFPFLLMNWIPMPWEHWALFCLVGIFAGAAQYAIASALKLAQASALASVDYSTLFWVVLLDFLWWSKTPEIHTLIGAALIVGSNLYIVYRTQKEKERVEETQPNL